MIEVAILALLVPEVPRLLDVRVESRGARRALRMTVAGPLEKADIAREGEELVLSLRAEARPGLLAPSPAPPVEGIRIETSGAHTRVRLRLAESVPHELQTEGGQLLLLLGSGQAEAPQATADLYRGLFPAPPPSAEPVEAVGEAAGSAAPTAAARGGIQLGPLALTPSLAVSAVLADSTPVAGAPIEERQLYIEPRLGLDLLLGSAHVTGAYTARLRRGTQVPELSTITESTTHVVDAGLELPLGAFLLLQVGEHFSTGYLETDEVDPGFEYFTNLGRYQRNELTALLRYTGPGRLGLELGGLYNEVDLEDEVPGQPGVKTDFFDYEIRAARAGLFFELTPDLRATLEASRFDTPTPEERPLAESTLDRLGLHLEGELSPLTQADAWIGYEWRTSPRAASAERFSGLGLGISVRRELAEGTTVELGASRTTRLSNFDENAYYLSSSVFAQASRSLPLELSLRAGAGYHWNDYQVASAPLGEPRADRIFGWSVGLGRPLSPWAYLRVDYGRQERSSNVRAFENVTDSLIVQLGIAKGETR
ncbi:MAG TPA: outer membrane beta-barrel protein [Vicinamibacteria bacterium]|nr:outer membrane beta-barrel protein [Vicinamibacteria bacterium]